MDRKENFRKRRAARFKPAKVALSQNNSHQCKHLTQFWPSRRNHGFMASFVTFHSDTIQARWYTVPIQSSTVAVSKPRRLPDPLLHPSKVDTGICRNICEIRKARSGRDTAQENYRRVSLHMHRDRVQGRAKWYKLHILREG